MEIDRETWQSIRSHFDRLLDLAPNERAAYLEAAELDDGQRVALAALLEAHEDDSDDPLAGTATELLNLKAASAPAPDWQGRSVGPWRVGQRLAEGGMSVVYSGRRDDGRFDMHVAIKVLITGRLNVDPERLLAETRILARLQHPGIARLIDSGAGDDGQPYLVMEFVDGTAIDRYCAEHGLDGHERVKLVLEVADALEYAHQRQVVHCDIKPSNILVRRDGRPCIVDFGISMLMHHDAPADDSTARFFSPGFSAPECLAHAPPDTSQDIFSLGAVLAELLVAGGVHTLADSATGRRTPTEELNPVAPPAHDGGGRLPRDLAAILRRARAPRPSGRYPSVGALAADLRAWLEHRPVSACNGGRSYALRKWFRRHRVAASLGILLGVSLFGGAGLALYQAGVARAEAARAVAVRDFTVGLFTAADPTTEDGGDPAASELLQRGAARVETELADQPRLLAEMLHLIGSTQLQRGLVDDATATLDRALGLMEADAGDLALRALALSDRGMAAYEQGRLDMAVELLRQSLRLAEAVELAPIEFAQIATRLADMHVVREEPALALELVNDVLDEGDAATRAYALRVKGAALELAGDLDAAADHLEQALAEQRRLDADHVFMAKILNDLGIVRWQQQRLNDAADAFVRSLEHKRRVYGEAHPQTLASLGNLAAVAAERGDLASAERVYVESLAALAALHGQDAHPDTAYTHGMLAWVLYRAGRLDDALEHARFGLDQTRTLGDDNPMLAWIPSLNGLIALELGVRGAAELLGPWTEECSDLDALSPLSQRVCLARGWLGAEPAACAAGLPPTASEDALAALPARWRGVRDGISAICAGTRTPDTPALPGWALRARQDP